MPAKHSLRIDFDEASGAVAVIHRCTAEVAGLEVSHAREVDLGPDAADALRAVLDANRATLEQETGALAVAHAAAVAGKAIPGVTPLKVGGSLGALGAADTKKAE